MSSHDHQPNQEYMSDTVMCYAQAKRGTPCYMAPELFQDGSTHSSAADLWALGCVLYECAAGHPPFVSTSFNHLVNDILTGDPAALPSKLSTFCMPDSGNECTLRYIDSFLSVCIRPASR